jgi:chromosome segregation ATPase
MSARTSVFFKRIEGLFHRNGKAHRNGHDVATNGHGNGNGAGELTYVVHAPEKSASSAALAHNGSTGLFSWGRRERSMQQLREAYGRVVELMDSMQAHFSRQDQRSTELTRSVQSVATTIEHLARQQESQGQTLGRAVEHIGGVVKQFGPVSASLLDLPASLHMQADAIRSVATQLEISQEADTQLMHSLQRFGQAVDALRESGASQVVTLTRLNASQAGERDALKTFIAAQNRRFAAVMAIVAGVVVAALAGGFWYIRFLVATHAI